MDNKEIAERLRDLVGLPAQNLRIGIRKLFTELDPPKPTLEEEFHNLIIGIIQGTIRETAFEIFDRETD